MTKIGYVSIGSSGPALDIQKLMLKTVGCDEIRSEPASSSSRDNQSELATVLKLLCEGDELVVHRLDHLGYSSRDVFNLVQELDAKNASLRILEPEVTTAGDKGKIVIAVIGMVADMELMFTRNRQRAGIDAAKRKGIYIGRRKSVNDDEIKRRIGLGISKSQIARELGISRMTVYRAISY